MVPLDPNLVSLSSASEGYVEDRPPSLEQTMTSDHEIAGLELSHERLRLSESARSRGLRIALAWQ